MNIFITGGTSGIGKCLAELYLAEGHRVGVCGGNREFFENNFKSNQENLFFYELDVRDRSEHIKTVAEFAEGKLNLFIACAGINQQGNNGTALNFDLAHKVIDINYIGVLNGVESAFEVMKKHRSGQIIALSSASAVAGFPGAAAYTSSKAAVMTMMEALSIDYRHYGITCQCICPGYVDTPLARGSQREKLPGLISAPAAAQHIKSAIERKKMLYFFPRLANLTMQIVRVMPRWLFRALEWHLNRKNIVADPVD